MRAGLLQPAYPGEGQVGKEWSRVRRVDNQWGKSRPNVILEEFCRLETLPIGEICPTQDPNAMVFKLWHQRGIAFVLLLDHADDYGAKICQKLSVLAVV